VKYSKIKTTFITITLFSAQALAAPENNIIGEVQRCSQVTDNSLRLTCFDKLAGQFSKTQRKNAS
jgi:hypothetical protein